MSAWLGQTLQCGGGALVPARNALPSANRRRVQTRSAAIDAPQQQSSEVEAPKPVADVPQLLQPPKRRPPIWRVPPSARTMASKQKHFAEQAAMRQEARRQDRQGPAGASSNGQGGNRMSLADKPDRPQRPPLGRDSRPGPASGPHGVGAPGPAAAGSGPGRGGRGERKGKGGPTCLLQPLFVLFPAAAGVQALHAPQQPPPARPPSRPCC
jgi:hypothetical protein